MAAELLKALVALVLEHGDDAWRVISPDVRGEVREELERSRARLPAPGAIVAATEAVIAADADRVRAHQQARAESVRGRYGISDTALLALERAARHAQTDAESDDLTAVRRFVEAAHRGELVAALPRVLDVPVGAWSEPGGEP
jgi:glutathione S-transferase